MAQRAEGGGVRGLAGEGRGWAWGGGALRGGRLHLRPLPSLPLRQYGHTQVIALLENAADIAAQVGPSTYT